MKFILGLIICSSVYNTCLEPYHWPNKFDSHYECMMFGYEESMKKAKEIGPKDVNEFGTIIKFYCYQEPQLRGLTIHYWKVIGRVSYKAWY